MELRQYRYALAAYRHGSFRGAAEMLGINQSLIGKAVRTLENRIGVTLFERGHWGIRTTDAGSAFLTAIAPAIEQIDFAQHAAASAGKVQRGIVRISVTSSLASGFLHDLLLHYSERYSGVRLVISDGSMHDNISLVQNRAVDVAFIVGAPSDHGCEALHLWDERPYIALNQNHKLTQSEEIDWHDLRNEHFIIRRSGSGPAVHDYLIRRMTNFTQRLKIEALDIPRDVLLGLVAIGRGISLVGEAAAATQIPGLTFRPVAGLTDSIPFYALWSPTNDNYAFRRFISLAKMIAEKKRKSVAATMQSRRE